MIQSVKGGATVIKAVRAVSLLQQVLYQHGVF
jgi:hypothetical protein